MPIDQNIDTPLQRDPNSIPIIADEAADGLKVVPVVIVTKSGGTFVYGGSVAKYPFSGSADVTQPFPEEMKGIVISNDGDTDLTLEINNDVYIIKGGEVFEEYFEPFTEAIVTTTAPFRAYGRV